MAAGLLEAQRFFGFKCVLLVLVSDRSDECPADLLVTSTHGAPVVRVTGRPSSLFLGYMAMGRSSSAVPTVNGGFTGALCSLALLPGAGRALSPSTP